MRVAIVEDDPDYSLQLGTYLNKIGAENGIRISSSCFENGQTFVDRYQPGSFDLILLDIEMPMLDGLSAAKVIRERDAEVLIIFITQMAQYAIRGYEVEALDYALKPLSYDSFSAKLKRVIRILGNRKPAFLTVQHNGEVSRISLSSISYIEVFNHTIIYHTCDAEYTITGSKTIRQLEEELSGNGFARCNQSYLVNLQYVDSVEQTVVVLSCGTSLAVSRNRRKPFLQALMEYWG